jgi:phytoene desaturase
MGPSWYWMRDIMDDFFRDFGYTTQDFFELVSLNPQFEMIFSEGRLAIPESYSDLKNLFESIEPGAGIQLDRFMQSAKYKYQVGMQDFVNKPCHHWSEFFSFKIIKSALRLDLLTNFRQYVSRYFTDARLRVLMEFPVIFLGASPKQIPALYSMMNYGGYVLGTWYPMGGFYQLVLAMQNVAERQGATFHFNHTAEKIYAENGSIRHLTINGENYPFDAVVAASDYHHTETLLPVKQRNYPEKYWQGRILAPSSLIYYLGIKERIPKLVHHTLFFENDLDAHIDSIYKTKKWPEKPLFYVCCPSKTDPSVAPPSCENLFLLMPLAPGITDEEETRETYLKEMLGRIEKHTGIRGLQSKIEYKKSYCVRDFIQDYNAYQGNAYGLANTLSQTAVLKPKIRNQSIKNLYYTGQLTVPGPGVPPAIISGKIVAQEINKLKTPSYEKTV